MVTDPITVEVVCSDCDGDGYQVEQYPVCCGRSSTGECCNNPEPEQAQVPCQPCGATGRVVQTLSPGSMSESMFILADAYKHWRMLSQKQVRDGSPMSVELSEAYIALETAFYNAISPGIIPLRFPNAE